MNEINNADNAQPTIRDFLEAQQWKHALFTTYALSLSYFESEVLRPLLQAGCDDIWLVADAQGYRASLLERRSMRVGQEYRLVPVGMPNGVFHPKCIYLSSSEQEMLLVGSGNLTFGGHGRNAEVFEALTPDSHATAFQDFADFLLGLGTRSDIQTGLTGWIDEFAARAEEASRRGADDKSTPPIRLLHPLETPIADQLVDTASTRGPCEELKIISPYFDPDGFAIQKLAERTGARKTTVAVTSPKSSPFPFAKAASWTMPITPKAPVLSGQNFVHAKWIEMTTADGTILLTGSVNATRKALATTDNVELGVLRLMDEKTSYLDWVECDAPSFDADVQMPSGLGSSEVVFARFDQRDTRVLKGSILSLQETAGPWTYRLIQADGASISGDVTIKDNGSFEVFDENLDGFSELPALQIVLKRDNREARGWVHNDLLLSIGSRRRLTAGALSRLMRRDGTDDDIQALLDYLSVQADKHLRIFNLPLASDDDEDVPNDTDEHTVSVRIDDLAPMSGLEPIEGIAIAADSAGHDHFETAMLRLRRMLLGHGRKLALSRLEGADAVVAEDEDSDEHRRTTDDDAYGLGLEDFERSLDQMIKDAADRLEALKGLLVIQLEVGMWMRLHRLDDVDGAREFLGRWFVNASKRGLVNEDSMSALTQHIFTSAAILAAFADISSGTTQLVALHDALERFCSGAVDEKLAIGSLLHDPKTGFASTLLPELDTNALEAALTGVLTTRTRRSQLEDALHLAEQGEEIPKDWEVFRSPLGQSLHGKLTKPNWRKQIKRAIPNYQACSHCWCSYPAQELNQFQSQRVGHCVQCKRYSLDIEP
ncbi:hypothetical protein [Jannaschia sp. M317]|uniref:hypothetical protein n=1 Tax=Jannaschia sp. M317 TaxID=2867011 RepID=UPI0021A77B1A|nr:hypothetical protein [Jannaschia sp. M317]UWQ19068.1 hypothetical protein K3551_07300 [Jannaschia sp. M317]